VREQPYSPEREIGTMRIRRRRPGKFVAATIIVAMGALTALPPAQPAHATTVQLAKKTITTTERNGKYVFSPATATIKVGTRVTWKNISDAPHTVTSDTATWKYDKKLMPGHTLQAVFSKAGTYKYHCTYHPGMVATLVVK